MLAGTLSAEQPPFEIESWEERLNERQPPTEIMDAIGVNNATLSDIVERLRSLPGMHGAKISGSGLGDCVVALGHGDASGLDYEVLDVDSSLEGVALV